MCGVAAIVSDGSPIPADAVERMADRLTHRGPDDRAVVRLPACHLGHTRLSVIDPAAGCQPMSDESDRWWIVFNGEIYNFPALRRQLEERGHRFRTQSDTEVLLVGYQEFGAAILERLVGQFAFVIWDQQERVAFAARDRLGEKPLYWCVSSQGHTLFGSEIRALIAAGLVRPRLDLVSVDAYLGLLYVPPHRTIYENVYTVPPGHSLTWRNGQVRLHKYWEPHYSGRADVTHEEAALHVRTLIDRAVQRQMISDVPIGAFLSGGLDSSTVVALMARHTPEPVRTFSVGFGDLINELPYAGAVASAYGTDHHAIDMTVPVAETLERLSDVFEEPFADSSNIPTFLMAQFASRHVKVVLAGDGGDELFGGYGWYRHLAAGPMGSLSLVGLGALRAKAIISRIVARVHHRPGGADLAALAYTGGLAARQHADIWDRHLAGATGARTDRKALWGNRAPPPTVRLLSEMYRPTAAVVGVDRAIDYDLRCYLPGDILVKVDRAAMAHGLETRAPFLDIELVEYVLGLPASLRVDAARPKALLRSACEDLWPEVVRARGKQGFGAPIGRWIVRDDVRALETRVCRSSSALSALLPGVRAALPEMTAQQRWTILCLGLWLERHDACLIPPA